MSDAARNETTEMTLEERVDRIERTLMCLGSHTTIRELRNDIGKLFAIVQSGSERVS